jgi:uncharacterized pyridoxal phosphate-containing UPF0001 family protein
MGVAPLSESDGSPAEPQRYFDQLKQVFDRLSSEHQVVLSMGMSADFIQAIRSGSTMVRIGSALFGARPSHTQ